jgi:hypothetical protein
MLRVTRKNFSDFFEKNMTQSTTSIPTEIFKERAKTIPEMVVNAENIAPLIDSVATFLANEFDNIPYNFTITHIRSAVVKVKRIKNSVFMDAVIAKLKTKPFKNMASTKTKKTKFEKEKEAIEIFDETSSSDNEDSNKDINL